MGPALLKRVLIKSETPVFAFAAKPDEDGNSRCNRIVLVTDELFKGDYVVVIEALNEVSLHGKNEFEVIKASRHMKKFGLKTKS